MNKTTLLRDRKTLKRLVEQYGKKDVLNFVRHINESVNASRYTSLQLADMLEMYYKDDNYTLDKVAEQIAKPWNDALVRVNLEPGINLLQDSEAEDVRDSGYFYMGVDSQANYMGIYDGLDYNGIETAVFPGIRIDKMGRVCPTVFTDDGLYIIEEMTPDSYASKFKTLLSYQNKNRDIDELINKLFRVIEVEW